jgi:hypothetical protein
MAGDRGGNAGKSINKELKGKQKWMRIWHKSYTIISQLKLHITDVHAQSRHPPIPNPFHTHSFNCQQQLPVCIAFISFHFIFPFFPFALSSSLSPAYLLDGRMSNQPI